MKKLPIITAVAAVGIAALGVTVASAQHRGLDAADTDGDGAISLAEFEAAHAARVRERFARMDRNDDGLLSGDELKHDRRGRHPGPRGRHHPDPERMVEHLDTDGSGGVSLAEMDGRRMMPTADEFYAADKDGSSELDAAELADLLESRFAQHRNRHFENDDSDE